MSTSVRWIASVSASALHAADCLLSGAVDKDSKLAGLLSEEVRGLSRDLESIGLSPAQFFGQAIPLTARTDHPGQLAETCLRKLLGHQQVDAAPMLTRRLSSLLGAYQAAQPNIIGELELRSVPLRDQWEARGPGLLAALRRFTEADMVTDSADVILVQPVLGGGGGAHARYNAVHLEAVLTNAHAELPETLRLAWLWGQLNLDLPKYEEQVGHGRLAVIGPLALLPAVLAAAQEVELGRYSADSVAAAIRAWNAPPVDPNRLVDWWATYSESDLAWGVALGALDRMLAE